MWSLIFLNIFLLLIVTLIIAGMTLLERKILSLMQRRIGPDFIGYKGRLQYIADALKLLAKGTLIPTEVNRFWFIFLPSMTIATAYSFLMNSVWGYNLVLFDIDYHLLYVILFSAIFNILILLTGYFSKSKYALLAAGRSGIASINLELFLGLLILSVCMASNSLSFIDIVAMQERCWFILLFSPVFGLVVITFLLETNRAPFDLTEAESELVAGYTIEYGGFLFGIYYLSEYLHLFFFSMFIVIVFFGGWNLPESIIFIIKLIMECYITLDLNIY